MASDDDGVYDSLSDEEVSNGPTLEQLQNLKTTVKESATQALVTRLGDIADKQESVGGIQSVQEALTRGISQLFVKVRNYAKTRQDEGKNVTS